MSTDQKYAENPANPHFIDLTAEQPVNQNPDFAALRAHPMAAEWRANHFKYIREQRELEAAQALAIDEEEDVYDLFDRFVSETPLTENTSVLREMEQAWQAQKDPKLAGTYMHIHMLRILSFLTALHKKWTVVMTEQRELAELISNDAEEGLSHE